MRQLFPIFCMFSAAVLLASCSNIPSAEFRGYASQPKVLSADHWAGLAEDSAREIGVVFKKAVNEKGSAAPIGVFIPEMPQDSAFYRSYSGQLKQALMQSGLPIRSTAHMSLVVNFKVETFLYSRRTGGRIPFTNNTMFAVLAAYVPEWFLESSWTDIRAGFISLVAITDILRAKSQITDAEAMLITSIEDGDDLILMSNQPFYIEPRDLLLYWTDQPTVAVMNSGIDRSKAPQLKNIKVVQ